MLKHKPEAYHNFQFSTLNLIDTIFAFLTAQNCLLNAQRILWLEISEF